MAAGLRDLDRLARVQAAGRGEHDDVGAGIGHRRRAWRRATRSPRRRSMRRPPRGWARGCRTPPRVRRALHVAATPRHGFARCGRSRRGQSATCGSGSRRVWASRDFMGRSRPHGTPPKIARPSKATHVRRKPAHHRAPREARRHPRAGRRHRVPERLQAQAPRRRTAAPARRQGERRAGAAEHPCDRRRPHDVEARDGQGELRHLAGRHRSASSSS